MKDDDWMRWRLNFLSTLHPFLRGRLLSGTFDACSRVKLRAIMQSFGQTPRKGIKSPHILPCTATLHMASAHIPVPATTIWHAERQKSDFDVCKTMVLLRLHVCLPLHEGLQWSFTQSNTSRERTCGD